MLEFLLIYRAVIQYALLIVALAFTFRIGAWPERLSAATLAGMTLADLAYHQAQAIGLIAIQAYPFHFGLDLAGLLAILAIALQANRIYPLWLTALQLISVLIHLLREVDPNVQPAAYVMLYVLPYYVMILTVTGGTMAHWLRERQSGPYRSWRTSSPQRALRIHRDQP